MRAYLQDDLHTANAGMSTQPVGDSISGANALCGENWDAMPH